MRGKINQTLNPTGWKHITPKVLDMPGKRDTREGRSNLGSRLDGNTIYPRVLDMVGKGNGKKDNPNLGSDWVETQLIPEVFILIDFLTRNLY